MGHMIVFELEDLTISWLDGRYSGDSLRSFSGKNHCDRAVEEKATRSWMWLNLEGEGLKIRNQGIQAGAATVNLGNEDVI